MNKALLMVAAAGMVGAMATGAMAQPAPAPQPPPQAQPGAPPPPPPGPQARGPMMPGFPPGEGGGMPGMMHGPRGWRHGPPPSRAAAFHIQRGDISVGVRCAAEEPTRACVDAAIALMDKANTLTTP